VADLFFATPVICGWEGFRLPHVKILRAEMLDKILALLGDYQILRKNNVAFRYLSDLARSVGSPRAFRDATVMTALYTYRLPKAIPYDTKVYFTNFLLCLQQNFLLPSNKTLCLIT
jgi:hypothetical protein